MPEGHTIHRYARQHRKLLAGPPLRVSSPQGRFAAGAALLDGRRMEDVAAYGKHLFYRWEGEQTLHVHLGLFGKFHAFVEEPSDPTPNTRLVMASPAAAVHLAGPTACELIDPAEEDRIRRRLGPDLLVGDADPELAWAALQRRRIAIGAALLDQRVLAGVGNVYRAEALFLCGVHPELAANELERADFDCLWSTLKRLLQLGVRSGRIITVDPAEAGRPRHRIPIAEGRYVYRRAGDPCRRCGAAVCSWQLAGRSIYACPDCQPAV